MRYIILYPPMTFSYCYHPSLLNKYVLLASMLLPQTPDYISFEKMTFKLLRSPQEIKNLDLCENNCDM
jgi:hypothetical protein